MTAAGVRIAPSNYCAARSSPPSARAVRDAVVTGKTKEVHETDYGVYGVRKIYAELARQGGVTGLTGARCTVARLMKAAGLQEIARMKSPRTTSSGKVATRAQTLSSETSPPQHATGCGSPTSPKFTRSAAELLMPLVDMVPPVRGKRGRPRFRPDTLYADRGYDHDKYRALVRAKGITPVIARSGSDHGSGLGVYRWVMEQTFALLHWFRRLRIRWEIRDEIHEAFLSLACGIICWRRLRNHSLC